MSSVKLARICLFFVALAATLALLTRPASSAHTTPASPRSSTCLSFDTIPGGPATSSNALTLPYCWAPVEAPPAESGYITLHDVDAISADDVWAVGVNPGGNGNQAVALHWNGMEWSHASLPVLPFNYGLIAVSGVASDDVWAVGAEHDPQATLALRWDGTEWSVIPTPAITGTESAFLVDVAAIAADDVWAVGWVSRSQYDNSVLILNWDGAQWNVIRDERCDGLCGLTSMSVISPNDIWVAGRSYDGNEDHGFLYRWDGAHWHYITHPTLYETGSVQGIAAVSDNDVWVSNDGGFLHWNGVSWSVFESPGVQAVDMEALSSNDIWAVGQLSLAHWDGTAWERFDAPIYDASLWAVTAVGEDDLWAAAGSIPGEGTLFLHYSSACLAPRCPGERFSDVCPGDYFYRHVLDLTDLGVVTGYVTSPPCDNPLYMPCFKPQNNVTRGQIAKVVSIAAGFAEPVSGQTFEDAPPGHTFYEYIERMASRGIINGYICGAPQEPCVPPDNRPYFRPAITVTRGQLSKMAALSFSFSEPVTGQTFEDVAPGHTFYSETERLADRSIINGYPCGGPGEPCIPPLNRPFFRPASNITRGQIAKIVNLARIQAFPTLTPTITSTSTPITSTSTPIDTNTPTPDSTGTSTGTTTPTATPGTSTATPTCCTDVGGSINAGCEPNPYYVTYTIVNMCPVTLTANIASYFQVSPNQNGPWQTLYIGDCFNCPIPPGANQYFGSVFSGPLPAGNNWWRYSRDYFGTGCQWSLNLVTDPEPACVTGTATPSPTSTSRSSPPDQP